MERIHVLHVLNSAHGGSAISTFDLIAALAEYGVRSSLVCLNNASEQQRRDIHNLVEGRVIFIPLYWVNKKIRVAGWKRPLIELWSLWQTWAGYRYQNAISALIKKEQINIIHTSTILNPEGAIAARRNRLPHAWHVRELIGPGMYFEFPFMSHWVRYISSHAELLIANSSITRASLTRFFDERKITTIPNGIQVSKFTVRNHIQREKLIVGMVGNVTSRLKNHEFFVKTAAHFSRDLNIEFRIYGVIPEISDDYYSFLRALCIDLQCEGHIIFMGYKAKPEVIMEEIDILFHPTPYESFGRIFIEAFASGIPVIAVKAGGALEMVKDNLNGFLISLNDVTAAVEKITLLRNSSDRRNEMGRYGRQLVEQAYTLDILVSRVVSVYNSLLIR